jgi:hypothetical protein
MRDGVKAIVALEGGSVHKGHSFGADVRFEFGHRGANRSISESDASRLGHMTTCTSYIS